MFCYTTAKPDEDDEMTEPQNYEAEAFFFCYPFYPQKYSARPEEESSDAELTDQTALPRPPESFSTMSLELKAARSSVHLLPRPQITLWLIKP